MQTQKQNGIPLVELFRAWQEEKDAFALDQLVRKYLHLVHGAAQRMKMSLPYTVDKDDLISWGHLGLMDALKKFDYQRGWAFETYAVPRIRGSMIDGLRQVDWVPRSLRDKGKKVEEAYRKLEQSLLRPPCQEELSEFLGMSHAELQKITTNLSMSYMVSLDEPLQSEEEPQTLMAKMVDEQAQNENLIMEKEQKRLLASMIDSLSEKERLVITMIYYEELSFSETAEVLGLTTGRISQLHKKAMSRLRLKFDEVFSKE